MSALIYNDTQINYEVSEAYGKLFLNSDICLGYGISKQALNDNLKRNQDELIEGTHYIYDYAMTNGGRQRVIKWTSLGVYHLGFFIKSKQAKEFRKFMANVANAIDMFKINDNSTNKSMLELKEEIEELKEDLQREEQNNRMISQFYDSANEYIKKLKKEISELKKEKENPFKGFYENRNRELGKRENPFLYSRDDWMMLLNECETQLGLERDRKTKTLLISGGAK